MGKDRGGKGAVERIYGYTGASGLIQAFATGYFVWDIVVSTRYLKIFGIGIWMHAVTALAVFSLGFVSIPRYVVSRSIYFVHLLIWWIPIATILQLLRPGIHSLRIVVSILEHPLVLRQA